uniref:TIL domain-containing protein n=1 Tax=viral metagenome TaxID=1070528 RepID=A0A6C0FCU9_9ZZZZ
MGMMSKFFVFFVSVTNMFQTIDSQAPCLGDIDNNLSVDVNDLLGVLSNFGMDCSVEPLPDEPLPDEPLPDESLPECVLGDDCGDQIWTECGTSCPPICGSPEPMICNMMCNVGYQCPHGLWWDGDTGNCVSLESCSEPLILPPDIAIGRPFLKETKNILSDIVYEKNDWN